MHLGKKVIRGCLIVMIAGSAFGRISYSQDNNEECEVLERNIEAFIDECQTCNTDDECFLDEKGLGCPFGCYFIRSHAYDDGEYLAWINEMVKEYQDSCEVCLYECDIPPETTDIGCRNNKCVDLRYYEE